MSAEIGSYIRQHEAVIAPLHKQYSLKFWDLSLDGTNNQFGEDTSCGTSADCIPPLFFHVNCCRATDSSESRTRGRAEPAGRGTTRRP